MPNKQLHLHSSAMRVAILGALLAIPMATAWAQGPAPTVAARQLPGPSNPLMTIPTQQGAIATTNGMVAPVTQPGATATNGAPSLPVKGMTAVPPGSAGSGATILPTGR